MAGIKVLIIPDVHTHPDFDNDRLRWLGRLILDQRPDEVWCLGDFADMPSLSSYDKGKRSFEGRRYKRDVESALAGQAELWAAVDSHNRRMKNNKKGGYHPYRLMLVGNHEARIDKVTQMNPELHETISVGDLGYDRFWDDVVAFKDRGIRHGFALSHYFAAGIMGTPIGGAHAAYNLLAKNGMSSIAGHSHLYDQKILTKADGTKMLAIVAGCYVHPEMVEGWNRDTQHLWWNGVVMLDGVRDGWAEQITQITQERIEEQYGHVQSTV